jgi:hypothetical protein
LNVNSKKLKCRKAYLLKIWKEQKRAAAISIGKQNKSLVLFSKYTWSNPIDW